MEPLNVIISGCSDVSLAEIEQAMSDWGSVDSPSCISTEKADVTSGGYVPQRESWRYASCYIGNALSLAGKENHVRIWNQPLPGSLYGAWFISEPPICTARRHRFKTESDFTEIVDIGTIV